MTSYFDLIFHHGGHIVRKGSVSYEGGKTTEMGMFDGDKLSLLDFDDMVVSLGYLKYSCLWFRDPTRELSDELILLRTDQDVVEMAKLVMGLECHIFIEHFVEDTPELRLPLPTVSVTNEDVEKLWSEYEMNVENEPPMEDSDHMVDEDDENEINVENEPTMEESDHLADDVHNERRKTDDEDSEGRGFVHKGVKAKSVRDLDITDEDDDDMRSVQDSSDDEQVDRFPVFKGLYDPARLRFKVGMLFTSLDELRLVLADYAIFDHRDIWFVKNDKRRLRAKCVDGCEWLLYARVLSDQSTVQIRTYYDNHTCPRSYTNKRMTAKWIANSCIGTIRFDPNMKSAILQSMVRERWGTGCGKSKAARAKRIGKAMIEGDFIDQFNHVRDYCAEILRTNPGSSCKVKASPEIIEHSAYDAACITKYRFERMYMCLAASKKGFVNGCRPLFGVDGCHLKGPCGGILLTAIGMDPNNKIFPIALAVVEGETKDSWTWFLECLQADIGHVNDKHWTVVSDQQKGLLPALADVMPGVDHRFCVRHLLSNFKKVHPGLQLSELVWAASKSTYPQSFEAQMAKIKELKKDAWSWLSKFAPKHWSMSSFNIFSKCDIVTNNITESYNAVLLDAREKPIIALFEHFREAQMERFQRNRDRVSTFNGSICPSIMKKLENEKKNINEWITTYAGSEKFQIKGLYHQFIVDLNVRTCTCRKWDLTGIPCIHAISAIFFNMLKPDMLVDGYYHKERYIKCYENVIYPINGRDMWPQVSTDVLLPPVYKRQPGRPKKLRRREADEPPHATGSMGRKRIQMKYTKCNAFGHNKCTCKAGAPNTQESQASSSRGSKKRVEARGGNSVKAGVDKRATDSGTQSVVESAV